MSGAYQRAMTRQTPRWLLGHDGEAYVEALTASRDAEDRALKDGVLMRFPETCPDDALYHLGATRELEQAPGESNASFRDRCQRAPEIHYWRGTATGLASVFEPFGLSAESVLVLSDYETTGGLSPDAWWSRVWILLDSTAGPWANDGTWSGGGTWDDGGTWDSTMTLAELQYIRRWIRKFKSPEAYPAVLFLVTDDDLYAAWDGSLWSLPALSFAVPLIIGHTWEEESEWLGASPGTWDESGDVWDDFA